MIVTALLLTGQIGCKASQSMSFHDFHIVLTPVSAMVSGMYGRIDNQSEEPIVISAATSDRFERIEFHESTKTDDRMRMEKIDSFKIDAHQSLSLNPGGIHIMLYRAKPALTAGEIIPVVFKVNDTSHTLQVIVREIQ